MGRRVDAPAAPLATNIIVNSTADGALAALAGNGTCDLREAIEAANTNTTVGECLAGMTGLDTITFSVTGTITLAAGELTISGALKVTGPGAEPNRFAGIRALHKTAAAATSLRLPVFPPFCQ
jgi:CSLREA domain-containing protein